MDQMKVKYTAVVRIWQSGKFFLLYNQPPEIYPIRDCQKEVGKRKERRNDDSLRMVNVMALRILHSVKHDLRAEI